MDTPTPPPDGLVGIRYFRDDERLMPQPGQYRAEPYDDGEGLKGFRLVPDPDGNVRID